MRMNTSKKTVGGVVFYVDPTVFFVCVKLFDIFIFNVYSKVYHAGHFGHDILAISSIV